MTANPKTSAMPAGERRAHERVATAIKGRFFIPAEESTLECEIVDLSAGGAGVRCAVPPPLQTYVILYIDGFGRFECVATRFHDGFLGLQFVCKEAKRQRLLRDLALYVNNGLSGVAELREHPRTPSSAAGHFKRPSGEEVRYDVIDMSLGGVSLKTGMRPPIGEIINLGRSCGRIIRHHEDGIAVQFLEPAASSEADDGS